MTRASSVRRRPRASASAAPSANGRLDLGAILEPIQQDLERVTDRLMVCLQNPVARLVAYLITAGGKRLRPALVLLAGRSGDHEAASPQLINLAAAVELIHTATLIHDDIIDQAMLRRRQPTFHARFGTERAVLMGDYLYATAFAVLAEVRDPYVTTRMAEVCQELSRGEFFEVDTRYNLALTEAQYLQIIRDKTASLIAGCCHLGAYVAKADPQAVQRLTEFGWQYGMAFQVMDDCLDLIGKEAVVGKNLRADLDKGALSLPVIYLAGSLSNAERSRLFAPLVARKGVDRRFVQRVASAARRSGAVDRAIATARGYVDGALKAVGHDEVVGCASTYEQLARHELARAD